MAIYDSVNSKGFEPIEGFITTNGKHLIVKGWSPILYYFWYTGIEISAN